MEDMLLRILPYVLNLASGILLAVCTYTINKARREREEAKKEQDKKDEAMSNGMQALLRESVVNGYNKWHERGYCPIYAKESLKRIYVAYHNLGGNDVATDLYNKILAMQTEPEETV